MLHCGVIEAQLSHLWEYEPNMRPCRLFALSFITHPQTGCPDAWLLSIPLSSSKYCTGFIYGRYSPKDLTTIKCLLNPICVGVKPPQYGLFDCSCRALERIVLAVSVHSDVVDGCENFVRATLGVKRAVTPARMAWCVSPFLF